MEICITEASEGDALKMLALEKNVCRLFKKQKKSRFENFSSAEEKGIHSFVNKELLADS